MLMDQRKTPEAPLPFADESTRLLAQLSLSSVPYKDPLAILDWSALNFHAFWLPEAAMSLYGVEEYHRLPEAKRRLLSQCEFINFIQAGFWLESLFVERIARSLRQHPRRIAHSIYHLHELREEAGHSLMFLELIRRCVQFAPNHRFHRATLVNFLARFAPFESAAFWVAVRLGEEIPDRMCRVMRQHKDEICPVIYRMTMLHSSDEARHIAHGKDKLAQMKLKPGTVTHWTLTQLLQRALPEFVRAFYYPSAQVYAAAGLLPGAVWQRRAQENAQRHEFVRACVEPTLRGIDRAGISLRFRETRGVHARS